MITAKEMVTALRICGNHPAMADLDCGDCPYERWCGGEAGSARMDREAADIIGGLLQELEKGGQNKRPPRSRGG